LTKSSSHPSKGAPPSPCSLSLSLSFAAKASGGTLSLSGRVHAPSNFIFWHLFGLWCVNAAPFCLDRFCGGAGPATEHTTTTTIGRVCRAPSEGRWRVRAVDAAHAHPRPPSAGDFRREMLCIDCGRRTWPNARPATLHILLHEWCNAVHQPRATHKLARPPLAGAGAVYPEGCTGVAALFFLYMPPLHQLWERSRPFLNNKTAPSCVLLRCYCSESLSFFLPLAVLFLLLASELWKNDICMQTLH